MNEQTRQPDSTIDDGPRNSMLAKMLRARRIFPYVVYFVGAVLGSAATIRIFTTGDDPMREVAWLLVSLLLYWLAFGLLERNERSWKIYQAAGSVLTGGLGIALVIITSKDIYLWITFKDAIMADTSIPWFISGVALIIWSLMLVANKGGACMLWQIAVLPIALYSFWWWKTQIAEVVKTQPGLVVLSALYFAVSMGVLLLLSYLVNRRATPKEDPKARKAWQGPRSFPSKYHELLARGRLCELFELPCDDPCPLATQVVSKYQKRRIQYRLYPEILDPFEKAYAILVTPHKRELCRVAHEILRAKEKQIGAKRYQDQEIYLWKTLWDRLQDGEYMGDPQKALRDKNRLLKEINPPDEK
ncbi:MAG: hypothetical protein ACYDCO_13825 [Armatimonadota bacterium]